MPTYEYACDNCHCENIEVVQSFKDEPLTLCDYCGDNSLRRVISGGLGFFTENRTVGAVADKNTDRFSDDYKEKLADAHATQKYNKDGSPIKKKPKKKPEKQFYQKNQTVTDAQLRTATVEQQKRYIETGKLN